MAPQFTRTRGERARRERSWSARASTSFPLPVSPRISTGTSVPATYSTRSITARKPVSVPTTASATSWRPSLLNNACLSASSDSRSRLSSRTRAVFASATPIGSRRCVSNSRSAGLNGERRETNITTPRGPSSAFNGAATQSPRKSAGLIMPRIGSPGTGPTAAADSRYQIRTSCIAASVRFDRVAATPGAFGRHGACATVSRPP